MRRLTRAALGAAAAVTMLAGWIAVPPPAVADTATAPGALQLTLSTPDPVLSGVASTYTITVTNTTPVTEWGTQIMDVLPVGLNLNTLLNPDVCARTNKPLAGGGAFNCSGGDIAPGGSTRVSFTATATQPVLYSDTAQVTGTVGGAWSGFVLVGGLFTSNSVSLPIQVSPGPTDIQVTGSASTGSPPLGSTFSYVFQVKDNGPQPSYGTTFDDVLPPSLVFVGVTTDTGTCAAGSVANTVHCDIGTLAVGAQAKIVLSAVAPSVSGSVTDTATVSMLGPDTHPASNSVSVTIQPK